MIVHRWSCWVPDCGRYCYLSNDYSETDLVDKTNEGDIGRSCEMLLAERGTLEDHTQGRNGECAYRALNIFMETDLNRFQILSHRSFKGKMQRNGHNLRASVGSRIALDAQHHTMGAVSCPDRTENWVSVKTESILHTELCLKIYLASWAVSTNA